MNYIFEVYLPRYDQEFEGEVGAATRKKKILGGLQGRSDTRV